MKIINKINESKGPLFSIEILPPLKGKDIQELYNGIDPLIEFDPAFIDVTYHSQELVTKKMKNGTVKQFAVHKRPGTVAICAALSNKYGVDTIPHLICTGFTKEDTENALIELGFLGIDNVLALRGDSRKGEQFFSPEVDGNQSSIELIEQISKINRGIYLDKDLQNTKKTDFSIGVAGYPEKHQDAPNFEADMAFLKKKIEAGGDYIVTQMFFDNKKFKEYVTRCRNAGITVPIIPGLKPITTKRQLMLLPKFFNIDIPFDLTKEVEKCKTKEDIAKVGVEWTTQQCKELIEFGAPVLHFYTMGKSDSTRKIASNIF